MAMKTKDRILNASLRLFNERGERNISTNHIAADLGMSPGNLYYHFRNKQQIVFTLFEQYSQRVQAFMALPEGRSVTFEDKVAYFEAIFSSMWEYRFLHRDLGHLLQEDEKLRQAYREFSLHTVARGKQILWGMREAGLMAATDTQIDEVMLNLWVIVTSWATFLQTILIRDEQPDTISQAQLRRGIYQIICLLEPYATVPEADALPKLKKAYLGNASVDPLSLF